MSKRQVFRQRKRQVALGDAKTPVVIQDFSINAPLDINIGMKRKKENAIPWRCSITQVTGVFIQDGSNVETSISHYFDGRALDSVKAEMMVLYRGSYYRVVGIQKEPDQDRFMRLLCTLRGDENKPVNEA